TSHRPPPCSALLPHWGGRSRTAAARGPAGENALPPLRQPRPHGASPCRDAERFCLGQGGPRLLGRGFGPPDVNAPAIEIRELGDADAPRWDAFVAQCPEATF